MCSVNTGSIPAPASTDLHLLDLLQLADSALPIGTQSHSFGLETLVAEGQVTVANLSSFLRDYLLETITIECAYCRSSYALACECDEPAAAELAGQAQQENRTSWGPAQREAWLLINRRLAALRPAHETRLASEVLGRRFLSLVAEVSGSSVLAAAQQTCKEARISCHHAAAFGLAGGALQLGADAVCLTYAQQGIATLLAAAQKLLPIGQSAITRIHWELKPVMAQVASQSRTLHANQTVAAGFAPLVELASMRHPALPVRLFIS